MLFRIKEVEVTSRTVVYGVDLSVEHRDQMRNASCTIFHDWDANTDSNQWYISYVDPEELEKPVREIEERIVAEVLTIQERKELITAEGKFADWVTGQDRLQSQIYAQRETIRELEVEKSDLRRALQEKERHEDTGECTGD